MAHQRPCARAGIQLLLFSLGLRVPKALSPSCPATQASEALCRVRVSLMKRNVIHSLLVSKSPLRLKSTINMNSTNIRLTFRIASSCLKEFD